MSELQSALNILGKENTLKRGSLRLKAADDIGNPSMNSFQSGGETLSGFDSDRAALHQNAIGAIGVDDAITGDAGAAVDPENPHIV